LPAW